MSEELDRVKVFLEGHGIRGTVMLQDLQEDWNPLKDFPGAQLIEARNTYIPAPGQSTTRIVAQLPRRVIDEWHAAKAAAAARAIEPVVAAAVVEEVISPSTEEPVIEAEASGSSHAIQNLVASIAEADRTFEEPQVEIEMAAAPAVDIVAAVEVPEVEVHVAAVSDDSSSTASSEEDTFMSATSSPVKPMVPTAAVVASPSQRLREIQQTIDEQSQRRRIERRRQDDSIDIVVQDDSTLSGTTTCAMAPASPSIARTVRDVYNEVAARRAARKKKEQEENCDNSPLRSGRKSPPPSPGAGRRGTPGYTGRNKKRNYYDAEY